MLVLLNQRHTNQQVDATMGKDGKNENWQKSVAFRCFVKGAISKCG